MHFFLLDTTYNNWRSRIDIHAIARLESHGLAYSQISGEKANVTRLLVNTAVGAYVFMGSIETELEPETMLIELLSSAEIEICAPVRVTALKVLRNLAE